MDCWSPQDTSIDDKENTTPATIIFTSPFQLCTNRRDREEYDANTEETPAVGRLYHRKGHMLISKYLMLCHGLKLASN